MNFVDRLKSDIQKVKKIDDNKKKLSFIWSYYKFFIIGFITVCLLLIVIISNFFKYRNVAMYVVMVNTDSAITEVNSDVFKDTLVKEGYDIGNKTIDIDASMSLGLELHEEEDVQTLQVLNALFTISDLDVFVADEDNFKRFADQDGFADLALLIDNELLNNYKLYKHTKENGQEVVDGIYLNVGSLLHKAGYYHDEVVIGACANGNGIEEAILLIKGLID